MTLLGSPRRARSKLSVLSLAEWEAYDRSSPAPTFFARPMWARALEEAHPQFVAEARRIAVPGGSDVVLPAIRMRNGPLSPWREVSATPFGCYSALLSLDGGLADQARAIQAVEKLMHEDIDRFEFTPWPLSGLDVPLTVPASRIAHETAIIDLRDGAEAAFARFKGVTRRMVGQSERRGVTCGPESGSHAIDVYYAMLLEATKRWGVAEPPFTKRLLESILHFGGDAAELWLVRHRGEAIAGGLILYGAQELFFWSAVMRHEFSALRPSNALNAALIRAAVDRGLPWYNLGASEGLPSVARFKATLGAESYRYVTLRRESPELTRYRRLSQRLQALRSIRPVTAPARPAARREAPTPPPANDGEYWENRARRYGVLAAGYLDRDQYEYEERLRWDAFERLCTVPSRARVLDIGCGLGRWSVRLAELGATVVAADISPRMIAMARKHPRVRYETCAVQDLDYPDESFDVILSVTVLQHITKHHEFARALANVRRMLAPDGTAFVLEFSPKTAPPAFDDGGYMRLRTYQQWRDAFESAGLRVARETGVRFVDVRLRGLSHTIERRLGLHETANGGTSGPIVTATNNAALATDFALARFGPTSPHSDVHAFALVRAPLSAR